MWKIFLAGKKGTPVNVTSDDALLVSNYTCPPMIPQKNKVFSQKFTTNGLASGTFDLGVSGAATPVEYYIPASSDTDIYITRITFILGYGSSAEGFEFADSGAALINGIKVSYINTFSEEVEVMNFKANYSFMRASGMSISVTSWEARGFAATGDYGYFVNISLVDLMPVFGVKLDQGTTQKMSILIRDDCTDADLFNCHAFGFERFM